MLSDSCPINLLSDKEPIQALSCRIYGARFLLAFAEMRHSEITAMPVLIIFLTIPVVFIKRQYGTYHIDNF